MAAQQSLRMILPSIPHTILMLTDVVAKQEACAPTGLCEADASRVLELHRPQLPQSCCSGACLAGRCMLLVVSMSWLHLMLLRYHGSTYTVRLITSRHVVDIINQMSCIFGPNTQSGSLGLYELALLHLHMHIMHHRLATSKLHFKIF